jgi:peptidoglycan hydrolase CwlO-like protein
MIETKPSETKPKKMVSRNVAIALGIICIILVAGLAGAFAYYLNDKNNTISSLNTQISSKDSQISQLNSQISDENNTISSLNTRISQLRSSVFQNQVFSDNATIAGLQKIANLQESEVIVLDYLVGNPQNSSSVLLSNNNCTSQ